MCGIYGFQLRPGYEMSEYELTMMSMVLADEMESRGRDSFGGIGIPTDEDEDKVARIVRGVGKVSEGGKELFRLAASSRSFLGHTRAATKGSVCIDNTHPFRSGDVLGVHNGVITNHDHLNHKYDRKFAVDSMHAFAHIDQDLPLTELWGYGTLFWLRSSEHWSKIHFAKTNGGSLHVAKIFRDEEDAKERADNHLGLIWASEINALRRVCGLLGFGMLQTILDENIMYEIIEGTVYTTKKPFLFGSHYKGRGYVAMDDAEEAENLWDQSWWNRNRTNASHSSGCRIPKKGESDKSERRLSRKERKALRKAQQKQRDSAVRKEWVADPIAENIYSGYGLQACYIPDVETDGKTDKQFLCPECECLLNEHEWGSCKNAGVAQSSCKSKNPQIACDIPQASLCGDCGHFLISGVHGVSITTGEYKVIECYQCGNYCAPEAMVVNADKDDENEPKPVPEGDKPTEIVLASGNNPYDTINEARKKLFQGPISPSNPWTEPVDA